MIPWRTIALASVLLAAATPPQSSLNGRWRAALDIAGGALPFELAVSPGGSGLVAEICNGPKCADQATVTIRGDSVHFDIADFFETQNFVEKFGRSIDVRDGHRDRLDRFH